MLDVKRLSVSYNTEKEVYALREVSFSVGKGEKIALIGANGAGKSSLLLTLAGVLPFISGEIYVEDLLLEKKRAALIRKNVGMIFQNPDDQLFMPTVYEDIAFGLRNNKVVEDEILKCIEEILKRLEISHLKDRLSHHLSGGEKRLAAMAGVLVMQPSIMLLDEPSSFLDPRARRRLIHILKILPQAMIISTHDMEMAMALCDRVLVLKEGQLIADTQIKEIVSNAQLMETYGL